ncbi:MAG: 16S rRNA (guanine(527)-N(7))-methyltransferase RsmG [Desulfobacterales bacterium]
MKIGSDTWKQLLLRGAEALGSPLDPRHIEMLTIFVEELLLWNRRFNLTRICDPKDIAIKHILDSLTPVPYLKPSGHVVDLGSGGGFPGIPLKVVRPDLRIDLVDASRKKVHFLKHVIRVLGLKGIQAHQKRAEELGRLGGYRGQYHAVVSRAFSDLDDLLDRAAPLLQGHGLLIAMKGRECESELSEVRGRIESEGLPFALDSRVFHLPESGDTRRLVLLTRLD